MLALLSIILQEMSANFNITSAYPLKDKTITIAYINFFNIFL